MMWAVFGIAVLMALANSVGFFAGALSVTSPMVYLGTIHYYLDYFFYLNHFFQGSRGAWLTVNRYTSEATAPSILYWSNVLMGKIGSFFGLLPVASYNLWVILLAGSILILSYFLLLRILSSPEKACVGFLFAAFSTSFMNRIHPEGKPMWYPFQLWRTPHFAFDRLGGVPHQMVVTLLFYLLVLLLWKKNTGARWHLPAIMITGFALTTVNPVPPILLLCVLAVSVLRKGQRIAIPTLLCVTVAIVSGFFVTNALTNTLPHLLSKQWEAIQQTKTTVPFLLASIGPLSLLFLAGLWPSVRSDNPTLGASALLVVLSYALFLSPVPHLAGIANARVVFPALYPFMAAVATDWVYRRKRLVRMVILITFLLISAPTIWWEVGQKIAFVASAPFDPMIQLPKTVLAGFEFLSDKKPYGAVALGNPDSHMDALIPALSGHTTYSGHPLATIQNDEKQHNARQFFSLQIRDPASWLKKNSIHFVVFTRYDGTKEFFMKSYPFLEAVYSNPDVTVFSYTL